MNIEHFMYIRVQRFSFSFLSLDIDGKKQNTNGNGQMNATGLQNQKMCLFFYPQNPSALIFKKKQQRNKLLLIQNKAKRAIIWPPQLQTCSGYVLPGMPCWLLWRQFDVILSSSCRCDDVNLMSKFSSNFTSILMSNVNEKNWRHINYSTKIWRQFDVILSSSCQRDDVNLMSKLTSNLTSILMSNVNENIDDTSIIWPKFDVNLTSFGRHPVDRMTSIWCQNWCQIWRQFWCQMLTKILTSLQLFDQNLT